MFYFRDRAIQLSQELREYEELEIQVKQLTGFNFKALFELFKMGYTLEPPEYELSMNQITRIAEVNRYV